LVDDPSVIERLKSLDEQEAKRLRIAANSLTIKKDDFVLLSIIDVKLKFTLLKRESPPNIIDTDFLHPRFYLRDLLPSSERRFSVFLFLRWFQGNQGTLSLEQFGNIITTLS